MINQLQKIFPSLITYKAALNRANDAYKWYMNDNNDIIGIDKKELTKKDEDLLATFLTPYDVKLPKPTVEETKWKELIHTDDPDETVKTGHTYRFVYFSIQKNQLDPISFKEAINELFDMQVPILWENEQEGIIIEEETPTLDENISYEQIIDVLMSDLYVKINFFVGPFLTDYRDAKAHYDALLKGAGIAFSYSEKTVLTYIDAIPYIFIEQADESLRKEIVHTVLRDITEDEELLKTIETFIQCNLNVSETAKELYMHRNSLQYRLDKFIEKTGIDIRQFHQAMTVYLALKAKK